MHLEGNPRFFFLFGLEFPFMNNDLSFTHVSPTPLQLEHTQGTLLTPSSPPSVNPFNASGIFIVINAFL